MSEPVKAIAIDYDGCIATNSWPSVGEPNWEVINRAKEEQGKGAKLILWTCREDDKLKEALDACAEWGLTFDAVNENLPEWKEAWGNDTRKIGATEYWDDRAVRMPMPWISVKDSLPEAWKEKGGDLINYLVFMPEYGVDVGNYAKPVKTWLCMGIPCKVTHWMPLPEPPMEGK